MKRLLIVLILFFSYTTCSQTAEEYFYKGNKKYNKGDINGAIEDFTKAIELDPDAADAYYNRGLSKRMLNDYSGAIVDYTKAIELDPDFAFAYNNRGLAKAELEDNYGAIEDFTKAIELDPDDADAYNSRGVLKYATGISDGCSDLMMAKELGHNVHPDAMKAICH